MNDQTKTTLAAPSGNLAQRISRNPYFRYVLFGVVLCLLPVLARSGVMPSSFLVNLGGGIIFAIVALGLNLLLGYSGLISLGTAGFMGLGAYISGYLTESVKLPFLVAVLAALIVAAFIGTLVGFVSLRVAGIYLAIATLCVSEILRKTFEELDEFTNGFSGLTASYPKLFGHALTREQSFLLLVVVLILVMILTHNLVNGQMGRALHAMRGSEVAAQAMGIHLLKYRLIVFALATVYAALGGALYMHFVKFSYPSTWIMMLSLNILAMVVIGGLRSLYGTVIGAFIVYVVPDLVLKRIPVIGKIDGIAYIFTGILIILVVMFYPQGVAQLKNDVVRLFRYLFGKNKEKEGAKHG
jgi:branched-chain amino acid transport system permease protein